MNTFKYLFRLFKTFSRQVAAFFLALQTEYAVMILLSGYIARGFINHLNGIPKDSLDLRAALLLLLLSLVLTLVCQAAAMYSSITVARHSMALICLNIMERLFKRPGGLPLPEDRRKGRPISEGQCLNTLSTDTITVPSMFDFVFEMTGMCLSGIAAFWIMYSINAFVTLVVFLPLAALFAVLNLFQKKIEPLAEKARRSAGEVSSMLSDMFSNVQTIKTSAAEGHFIEEFRRRNERRLADSMKSQLFFSLLKGLNSGLMEIGAAVILLACAGSMRRGTFTIGDFILFTSYLWAVLGIFRWGGSLIAEVKRQNVAIDRMESLMAPEPPLSPVKARKLSLAKVPEVRLSIDRGASEPLRRLEVEGLAFRYSFKKEEPEEDGADETGEGAKEASEERPVEDAECIPFGIESIDFTLVGGSLTVVTGAIGSGKTTLLKSLLGFLPAQAIKMAWNGEEVPRRDDLERGQFWRAPRSAYTPQVPRLFSDSLKGNILLGIPEEDVDLGALVAQACLETDLREMPEGLATPIGPRGVRLSGGQIQRAAAARMFARGASLNVLDDISSALDVETEARLWDRLMTGGEGRTFLVVSHREALLRRADQILLMDGGCIVARGRFDELIAESALFRGLLAQAEPSAAN